MAAKAHRGHYRHGKVHRGRKQEKLSRGLCASKESNKDQTGSHTLSRWPGAAPPSPPCCGGLLWAGDEVGKVGLAPS